MIYGLTVREQRERNRFLLEVVYSKGTYIRTLAADLGNGWGSGLPDLPVPVGFRRQRCDHAYTVDEIRAAGQGRPFLCSRPKRHWENCPPFVLGGMGIRIAKRQTIVPANL